MGVFSQYSHPRKYNYREIGDLNMNCMSEHESILRDYLKEETKCWIDDDTFTVTDLAEKILESICKSMYEIYAIDPEFETEEYVKLFQRSMKKEFFKRQVKQKSKDINYSDFASEFEDFKRLMIQANLSGEWAKQLQDILNKEDTNKKTNESYLKLNAKSREFYNHYIREDVELKDVYISEDALLLYLIMFAIWLHGKDCDNIEIKKLKGSLSNYRKRTGAKSGMQDVIYWCIKCCLDLVLYNTELFTDEKTLGITTYGINEFCDQFSFVEVTVKYNLRSILLNCFTSDEKTIPFDEFTNFMMQFRLDSLSTDKPFMGKWGAPQKTNGNKRYASTNYQYIKKYLKDYFKPQFDEDFEYKYFDFSVDPETLNDFSKEDEMMMWKKKNYNHLVSYIFVLLDLPNDNYLSESGLQDLLHDFFLEMNVINNINDTMQDWEEQYRVVRGSLRQKINHVREVLEQTEEHCQTILDEFNLIWTSGRLEVSAPFLDKLAKMPGDEIRTKDGKEIYWEGGDDLCKIMTEMYLRIFI